MDDYHSHNERRVSLLRSWEDEEINKYLSSKAAKKLGSSEGPNKLPFSEKINRFRISSGLKRRRPRCGFCLFSLSPHAKPLRLDEREDGYGRRPFSEAELRSSVERGCEVCAKIVDIIRTQRKTGTFSFAYWYPLGSDLRLFDGEESTPKDRFHLFVPTSVWSEDINQIQSWITWGNEVEGSTGDNRTLDQAAAWLRDCKMSHEKCKTQDASFMPTRLLSIADEDVPIRLVETEHSPPLEYAALSHRWSEETERIILLRGNYETRKQHGLNISEFPPMLRDVIYLLRHLGIHYVWIDCLCIIQQDREDWKREAGTMASVYRNATLTVAATLCNGSGESLFRDRGDTWTSFPVANAEGKEIRMRRTVEHLPSLNNDWASSEALLHQEWPLLSRGWVCQEQLLSRRMLHFTRSEIMWECNETKGCECGYYSFDWKVNYGDMRAEHVESSNNNMLSEPWSAIVKAFTSRDFTFASDRLVALAGVARAFGEAKGWTYICGMWKEDLRKLLLWERISGSPTSRPEIPAPTWSWASASGPVHYYPVETDAEIDALFAIDDCEHEIKGDPYMGDILNAKVTITGWCFPATLLHGEDWANVVKTDSDPRHVDSARYQHKGPNDTGLQIEEFYFSFLPDCSLNTGDSIASGSKVWCLVVGYDAEVNMGAARLQHPVCLILHDVSVDSKGDCYKRIGLLRAGIDTLSLKWVYQFAERRRMILI